MRSLLKAWAGGLVAGLFFLTSCADSAVTGVQEQAVLLSGAVVGNRVDAERYRAQVHLVPDDGRHELVLVHILGTRDGGRDALVRRVADGIASGRIAPERRMRFAISNVELRSLSPQYYAIEWLD